jgi:hypothetical protein
MWELQRTTLRQEFPECSHFNALPEQEAVDIGARLARRALSQMEVLSAAGAIVRWQSDGDVADPMRVTHETFDGRGGLETHSGSFADRRDNAPRSTVEKPK